MASAAPTMTATADDLVLKAPDPLPSVAPEKAAGLVPVSDEKKSQLEERVDAFIADLVAQDAASPAFGERASAVARIGQKEIRELASRSNRFLDKPVRAMEGGVGANLIELRQVVESLDPSRGGGLTGYRKILGFIPFGLKIDGYFDQYRSSQTHIAEILKTLAAGRDELLMDNAAVDVERGNIWEAMGRLEQMIHLTRNLDERLEQAADDLDATDPAKAKAIRESALFECRQRHQDLLTQMAVSVQGYLALDMVKKNNVELIKGVDRASTTTVSALRTAVTVAQALASQRLVLDQITALNTTTAGIIDGTSAMLKQNTAKIHDQAASATIPVETLQRAFQNIYDTMDAIDSFKGKALVTMKGTVDVLSREVDKSRGYIARAEGADGRGAKVESIDAKLLAVD